MDPSFACTPVTVMPAWAAEVVAAELARTATLATAPKAPRRMVHFVLIMLSSTLQIAVPPSMR